jgi:hypothetical protein
MGSTTPPPGQRPPSPHRTALAVLAVFYALGLAATAFLLVSRAVRFDWRHLWATWTQPPVHHPVGYVAPHLPAHLKLPPAPVIRHAPRVIVWHTLSPVLARREPLTRWPIRGTKRVRMVPPSQAPHQLAMVRAPQRAPVPTWAPQRATMPAWSPQRAPMPTWAHPPDPTLPPECRPRNPVVVGQD